MKTFVLSLSWALLLTGPLSAVETKSWEQKSRADFEKGDLKKLSLRSDGRLSLAPVFREVLDSATPYLWTLAQDSKGNLYAGGGGPTGSTSKLFLIDPSGKSKKLAELDGLEIHALAIDKKDHIFAATAPDSKIYRISSSGKEELFYDPKAKYIWAMAFDSKGNLFVATGDKGEIHKVTPDGKGSVFFKTEETHARSLCIDAKDNLIVGTEPGGLILRVSQAGEGFVLHQAARREVTAVAVNVDGNIYAAAVGNKTPASAPSLAPAPSTSPSPSAGTMTVTISPQRTTSTPPPTLTPTAPSISGGSEVYRIDTDGFPRRVWSDSSEIVYVIGFDKEGKVLLGTGNKGNIYRLDSDSLFSLLVAASPTQVTAISSGPGGRIFAATGNIGKVYQLGPDFEKQGTIESDVLDAGIFSYWGRLACQSTANGGKITLSARSGNLDRPQKNWSEWAPANDRITSPPARFLQWRLTLAASPEGRSPETTSIEAAYQPRNVAPVIDEIEITPANYRFPASSTTLTSAPTLSLPPIGQQRRSSTLTLSESSISMSYAKGSIGARWRAADDNGDTLLYKVDIRGVGEVEWKVLKDKLKDKHLSWDSTAFPDGQYELRVTVSDAPSNPPEHELSRSAQSAPFLIDNTPPRITGLTAAVNESRITVRWKAADTASVIDKAEFSVNGGDWLVVEPTTRLSDSKEHDYELTVSKGSTSETTIAVRVADDYDNQAVEKTVVK